MLKLPSSVSCILYSIFRWGWAEGLLLPLPLLLLFRFTFDVSRLTASYEEKTHGRPAPIQGERRGF